MRKSRQRLLVVSICAVVLGVAVTLGWIGLSSQAAFFRTPSQVLAGGLEQGRTVRVGGLVTPGTIRTQEAGGIVFELADDVASIEVGYVGVLPSLFREGQCVIAEGSLGADGRFDASRVLAKHDADYRAPEIEGAASLAASCGRAVTAAAS